MFQTLLPTTASIAAILALTLSGQAQEKKEKTHLFVLSGQSNMYHMKSAVSFAPAVKAAFGEDRVIIAQNAKRGAAIRNWDKDYVWPEDRKVPQGRKRPGDKEKTREEFLANFGNLYDSLMETIKKNTEGKTYDTVTFVWMQGESDSGDESVPQYEESFNRVLKRLKSDLGVEDMNVVIGRLSDYSDRPAWMQMRELQMKMADAHPNWAWVNTDDLNDVEKGGKKANDLHYTEEGYKILGERFAGKAIELLKKQ